MENLIR